MKMGVWWMTGGWYVSLPFNTWYDREPEENMVNAWYFTFDEGTFFLPESQWFRKLQGNASPRIVTMTEWWDTFGEWLN